MYKKVTLIVGAFGILALPLALLASNPVLAKKHHKAPHVKEDKQTPTGGESGGKPGRS